MKYTALLLDVDGTTIPYDYTALPSESVVKAIKAAQTKVSVNLVTARAYLSIKNIINSLDLKSGFVAVNNGAQIINPRTDEVIYDCPIDVSDAKSIANILFQKKIKFHIKQGLEGTQYNHFFQQDQLIEKPYMILTGHDFSDSEIKQIIHDLSCFKNVAIHQTHHKEANKFGFIISHVNATKLHAVNTIFEQLKINSEEAIGVGDSYNDFPLLMACGLKVAMGNAVDDLKAIADYIAPSVEEDGVADVINKFILEK